MLRYECPHCGAELESPESMRGHIEHCPDCKGPVRVPESDLSRKRSRWSAKNMLIVAIAIIAAIVLARIVGTTESLRERQKETAKETEGNGLCSPLLASQAPTGFSKHSSARDGFAVFFPGEPEFKSYGLSGKPDSSGPIRNYAVVVEGEGAYNVFVNIFPKPILTDRAISAALDGYVKSKFEFLGDAASLVQSAYVLLKGHKALEYEYVVDMDGDVSCFKGICLVKGTRLYAITVVCLPNIKKVAFEKYAEMVDSFRLIELQAAKPPEGLEGFFEAIRRNDHLKVREGLIRNPDWVRTKNEEGETPLHVAAFENRKAVAELLIAKGADINATGDTFFLDTPLHVAVEMGNKEVAEMLIEKGSDVNAKNKAHYTPLHRAAQSLRGGGNPELVKLLIKKGANANANTSAGLTPLHFTARRGHIVVAELLIANGADVNARGFGETILEGALRKEQMEMARLLRKHGAKK